MSVDFKDIDKQWERFDPGFDQAKWVEVPIEFPAGLIREERKVIPVDFHPDHGPKRRIREK